MLAFWSDHAIENGSEVSLQIGLARFLEVVTWLQIMGSSLDLLTSWDDLKNIIMQPPPFCKSATSTA